MKRHNGKGEDVASDAPVQACRIEDVDAVNLAIALRDGNAFNSVPSGKKCTDEFYRACLVIVPQAGVFYCHRERRPLSLDGGTEFACANGHKLVATQA